MIEKILQQVKRKEDDWYSQKEIYALPDWFTLVSAPEMISLLAVYGKSGLDVIKQKVEFEVDFKNKDSIQYYVNYLEQLMNKDLPIIGYVFFYEKNMKGIKDSAYPYALTSAQKLELDQFNQHQKQVDITVAYVDSGYNLVESL